MFYVSQMANRFNFIMRSAALKTVSSLRSFLLLSTFSLLNLYGHSAAAQLQLGEPSYAGSGCPDGSAHVALTSDGSLLSVLFDQFLVDAGGSSPSAIDRKNCRLNIPLTVSPGYSVSIIAMDYKGFAAVPSQAIVRFSADYSFANSRGATYTKDLVGPLNTNFTYRNDIRVTSRTWSSCGAQTNLNASINLEAYTNTQHEQVAGSMDSVDVSSGVVYSIQYRRCSAGGNGSAPTTPTNPPPTGGGNPLPPTHPVNPPISSGANDVTGYIDGFNDFGASGYFLSGWACSRGMNHSIDVHIYLDAPAGRGGTFLKSAAADQTNEPAVSQACGTAGVGHRFNVPFTLFELKQVSGRAIYAHGLSRIGRENLLLNNSGQFRFPRINDNVQGRIQRIQGNGGGGSAVVGAVCVMSLAVTTIELRLYAGGPQGVGQLVDSVVTDTLPVVAEDDILNCPIGYIRRGFVFNVSREDVLPYFMQKSWVYGVNPASGELHELQNSGVFNLGVFEDPR